MAYRPVIYPGFGWTNLKGKDAAGATVPRLGGEFYWRQFATAADRNEVEWSFKIVRGPLIPDMVGGEHDFVVAGAVSRPIGDHFRIASRWWSWMSTVGRPFLLAKCEWQTGGSVLTLLRRRDPTSARTLGIAAQIAGFRSGTLTVAATPGLAGSDDFTAWVSELLRGRSLSFQTEPAATEPAVLQQRMIELDCRHFMPWRRCAIVRGPVASSGTCRLWEAKDPGAENLRGN